MSIEITTWLRAFFAVQATAMESRGFVEVDGGDAAHGCVVARTSRRSTCQKLPASGGRVLHGVPGRCGPIPR